MLLLRPVAPALFGNRRYRKAVGDAANVAAD